MQKRTREGALFLALAILDIWSDSKNDKTVKLTYQST